MLEVVRGRSFCNLDFAPRRVERSRLTEREEEEDDDDDDEACSADMMNGGEREGARRGCEEGGSK